MIETKTVDVNLCYRDEKYMLIFGLKEQKEIDLYDMDTIQIKNLFLELMKEIVDKNIELNFKIDDTAREGKNNLAIEIAEEYIESLKLELESLYQSKDLIDLRAIDPNKVKLSI